MDEYDLCDTRASRDLRGWHGCMECWACTVVSNIRHKFGSKYTYISQARWARRAMVWIVLPRPCAAHSNQETILESIHSIVRELRGYSTTAVVAPLRIDVFNACTIWAFSQAPIDTKMVLAISKARSDLATF